MRQMDRRYLLVLLTVILAFNYVDRFAMGLLVEDIKRDLALSDTQLGLLTGLAFALFYSVMGLPIARWADRGDRVTILSLTTALWSAAVALCGIAANFGQLLAIRIGVAVGEAGCYSPALSLLSDHYDRSERPRAVARFMLGIPLAMIIGYFVAGWINELYGWRVTFVVIGLPGLILAALAYWTLTEPRRGLDRAEVANSVPTEPLRSVCRTLYANIAYRHLLLCFSIWGFFGYGIMQWQPAFFIRSYGIDTGALGTWLVIVAGFGGLAGTWAGGELAARYAANNERRQLLTVAVVYALLAISGAAVYLAPTIEWAFAALAITSIGGAGASGPLFAASQTLVPPHMRATSIAVMYFFCNLIGLGLGPLAVGALSDALQPALGRESLRYALLAFAPGYLWCAWHLWRAGQAAEAVANAQEAADALLTKSIASTART